MNYISMNRNYITSLKHNVLSKSSNTGKTPMIVEPVKMETQNELQGSGMKKNIRNDTNRKLNKFINLKI